MMAKTMNHSTKVHVRDYVRDYHQKKNRMIKSIHQDIGTWQVAEDACVS